MKSILRCLSLFLFSSFGLAAVAQPDNQSFNPADAAFVTNPFIYHGVTYTQVAPTPASSTGMRIDYPGSFFAIVNNDGSDAALIYNYESTGTSEPGPADFRFSSPGVSFKLNSMEADASAGFGGSVTATVTGYLNGDPIAGASGTIDLSASTSSDGGISYVNNGIGGNGGTLTFNSNWQYLDEIRITGTNLIFGIDDLNFSPPVIALPVTLSFFTATNPDDNTVQLRWRTETETGNSYFIIQRSTDGINYSDLDRVNGRGTYTGTTDYSFTDIQPADGNNYYRLAQYDLDGRVSFSSIRRIKINSAFVLKAYPNPVIAGNSFMLKAIGISPGETYLLIGMDGKVMRSGILSNTVQAISTVGLPAGLYTIKLKRSKQLMIGIY